MKKVLMLLAVLPLVATIAYGQRSAFPPTDRPLRIICIGAHPDDCDAKMGGTAALYAQMGHKVRFVSITNGNAGHHEMGGGVLAQRRRAESDEAAVRLGLDSYVVLDYHDGELLPTLEPRKDVIRQIREFEADIVFALRPWDYHPDHRYAGILVQDAAYMVMVPNIVSDTPALGHNPLFMYLSDGFQRPNPHRPDVVVRIDDVIDAKVAGLDAHDSQMYEWLPWISGRLEEVPSDPAERRAWLAQRWARANVSPELAQRLAHWYGQNAVGRTNYVEAFEVCEYGYRPSEDDLRIFFPMIGR
jgi:LmbE family N-acetylglucosaminyl deacetylase